jgi:predicted nuclease with TOPRIM domain
VIRPRVDIHHVEQLAYGRQSTTAQHLNLQDLALDYLDALKRVEEEFRYLKRQLENCDDELNTESNINDQLREDLYRAEGEIKRLQERIKKLEARDEP